MNLCVSIQMSVPSAASFTHKTLRKMHRNTSVPFPWNDFLAMGQLVPLKRSVIDERFLAHTTQIQEPQMRSYVILEVVITTEAFATRFTSEPVLSDVLLHVPLQMASLGVTLFAERAGELVPVDFLVVISLSRRLFGKHVTRTHFATYQYSRQRSQTRKQAIQKPFEAKAGESRSVC